MNQKTIYVIIVLIIVVLVGYAIYISQKPAATQPLPNNQGQFQGPNNIPVGGNQNVIDDRVDGGGLFQTPDDRRRGADKPEN